MEIKREIYSGQELDIKLKKGIDKLANAVKVTMGPKGKLVLINREGRHPIVTKDGVTVAQSINLVDEVENLGVQVLKESASRTAEEAGDGTSNPNGCGNASRCTGGSSDAARCPVPWSSHKVSVDNDSVANGDHEVSVGSRRCHRGGVRG